jgi:hypothetical protein
MYKKVFRRALFPLLLAIVTSIGVAQVSSNYPRSESCSADSNTTYNRVLDLLFPREEGDFLSKEFILVLRFRPSFDPESQVNITKYKDGRTEVILYTLSSKKNVHYQLIDIRKQLGSDDAQVLAGAIPVQKKVLKSLSTELQRLVNQFANLRFSPKLDTSLYLDPTQYEMWYETVSNEVYFSFAGPETGKRHYENPIINWMNKVLQTIE